MKTLTSKVLIIFALLLLSNVIQAQKLGDLLKKTSKGIQDGVTDILADKLADKIVDATVKKINSRMDSLFQEAYKADTTATNSSATYGDFLSGMDESDKVGESYNFTLSTKMKMVDQDGAETLMSHYFSADGLVFGMQTEGMMIVLDAENKIMITYNIEEKTAYAFGEKLIRYSSHLIPDNLIPSYTIESAAGKKDILGYSCNKYIGKNDDGNYEVYVTDEFPISVQEAYGAIGKTFMDNRFNDSYESLHGFALESIYTEKNGNKTHSTVTEIDKSGFTIDNLEYQFGAQ